MTSVWGVSLSSIESMLGLDPDGSDDRRLLKTNVLDLRVCVFPMGLGLLLLLCTEPFWLLLAWLWTPPPPVVGLLAPPPFGDDGLSFGSGIRMDNITLINCLPGTFNASLCCSLFQTWWGVVLPSVPTLEPTPVLPLLDGRKGLAVDPPPNQ